MREDKKKRLEAKGWKIGTTKDFLDLSPDEEADRANVFDIQLLAGRLLRTVEGHLPQRGHRHRPPRPPASLRRRHRRRASGCAGIGHGHRARGGRQAARRVDAA